MFITTYEWEESSFSKFTEHLPQNVPAPKGNHAVTISYHDSNLRHNFLSRISDTGVLHFLNKTPVDWHRKKQAVVETATCGS